MLFALMLTAAPAEAARISKAEKVLATEGTAAFLALVQQPMIGQIYIQEGYSHLRVWSPDGPVLAVEDDTYAAQTNYTIRMQETNGVGFTIEEVRHYFYSPLWDSVHDAFPVTFSGQTTYVPPYGSFQYKAGCPRSGNTRFEIVVVIGTDDNGHELEYYGIVERLNFTTADAARQLWDPDPEHDLARLRHQAAFQVEVANGVWWVPAAHLGQSRYTNQEIAGMLQFKPEEKQARIATLYEALQLFQIGQFADANDNQRILENNIHWEHHKPGYHAVRTNEGCCASDTSWLNYLLRGDYEQTGMIAYSQSDGNGHVFNYILHEGYYYIIDLTHYRTDWLSASAMESGSTADYRASDYIAGNVHKAASLEAYVSYYLAQANDPPELFFTYSAEDCLPVDSLHMGAGVCITYSNAVPVTVLYDDPYDSTTYQFVNGPKKNYGWNNLPTAKFSADARYLSSEAAPELAPFFAPGDVIPLVDYGLEARFAEINGVDYLLCESSTHCIFHFEQDLLLPGMAHYSYHDYVLDPMMHQGVLEQMESLRLGEIMIDLILDGEKLQVARCVEKDQALVVTDIITNEHYFEPVYMRRDENGAWLPTDKVWYVIHYEANGQTYQEYARFYCGVQN